MEPTSDNARESAPKSPNSSASDDYLAHQIADARLALKSTFDDLTLDVARAADVRRWVRRYPWAALGTALVAGFAVGHCVAKSRRHRDTAAPPEDEGDSEVASNAKSAGARPTRQTTTGRESTGGWRSTMISALFDLLRLAVTQFVSASVRQAASNVVRRQAAPRRAGPSATPDAPAAAPEATSADSDPII